MTQEEYYQAMVDTLKDIKELIATHTQVTVEKNISVNVDKTLENLEKTVETQKKVDTTIYQQPTFISNGKLSIVNSLTLSRPSLLPNIQTGTTYTIAPSANYAGRTFSCRESLDDRIYSYLTHGTGNKAYIPFWLGTLSTNETARRSLGLQ